MESKYILPTLGQWKRRASVYGRNSSPFLSGDLFRSIADYEFKGEAGPLRRERQRLQDARVIFCESYKLEAFLEVAHFATSAKILILGNSDRDFEDFDFPLPSNLKMVFAQNLMRPSDKVRPLPIGLENLRLANNGFPALFSDQYLRQEKSARVLIGPFSPTHPERAELMAIAPGQYPNLEVIQERLSPRQLASIASLFGWVAAPRGNGLDTHRFWEALYRGSVPIVLETEWSRYWLKTGLPLRQVENWQPTSMASMGSPVIFDPKRIPILWKSYWLNEFKKYV